MSDKDQKQTADAQPASEAEITDEQLWNELAGSEMGNSANEDRDDGLGDDDPAPSADAKPRAPSPSKDTGDDGDAPDFEDDGPEDDEPPASQPAAAEAEAKKPTYEDLQAQTERLRKALDSEKGRSASRGQEIRHLRDKLSRSTAKAGDRDDEAVRTERSERQRKMDEAREDYGDAVGPLIDTIKEMQGRFDELSAREAQELNAAQARFDDLVAEQTSILLEEHSDWLDVLKQDFPAFKTWLEDQPKALRDAYEANRQHITDGTGAALLVTAYKQSLYSGEDGASPAPSQNGNRLQNRRQRQLDGAQAPRSKASPRMSSEPPADSSDDEAHWNYWAAKERREQQRR